MGNLRGSEWLILALIVILLFGAKKLPEAARGLGRSLRIFKSEIKQPDTADDTDVEAHGSTAVTPTTAAIVQAPVQPASTAPPAAPAYVPVQAAPIPAAPVAPPVKSLSDETSVQSMNERFYGQENSDR